MLERRKPVNLKSPEGAELSRLQLETRLREIDRELAMRALNRLGMKWVLVPGSVAIVTMISVRLLDSGLTPLTGLMLMGLLVLTVVVVVGAFRHLDSAEADLEVAKDHLSDLLEAKLAPTVRGPEFPS